jgi:hypothetical protein
MMCSCSAASTLCEWNRALDGKALSCDRCIKGKKKCILIKTGVVGTDVCVKEFPKRLKRRKVDHNSNSDNLLEIMQELLNTVKKVCDTVSAERRLWSITMQELLKELSSTHACQAELNSYLKEIGAHLQVPQSGGVEIFGPQSTDAVQIGSNKAEMIASEIPDVSIGDEGRGKQPGSDVSG